MSAVDTAWLRMDSPGNAMMIVSVMTTATPVPLAELRRVIETRLAVLSALPPAAGAGCARARPGRRTPTFDLDAAPRADGAACRRAASASWKRWSARLASARLDPSRPLWQVHFVPRFGPGSAWILRLHHCYADGMAMLRVLLSLSEQDAGPALAAQSQARPPPGAARRGAPLLSLIDWLEDLAQPTGDVLENALAGGTRLLESGIHQLFHPDAAAQLARHAGGMAGELARLLTLPDDPPSPLRRPLVRQQARGVGAPLAAGRSADGGARARLHRQRRAAGNGRRRAGRAPATRARGARP